MTDQSFASYPTPDEIAQRRAYANMLLQNQQPVKSWAQGLGNVVNALMGGITMRGANNDARNATTEANSQLAQILMGGSGASSPSPDAAATSTALAGPPLGLGAGDTSSAPVGTVARGATLPDPSTVFHMPGENADTAGQPPMDRSFKWPGEAGPAAPSASGDIGKYANSISGIESGGRYDLVGPQTSNGDRAYGKYQVMGANVPEWTKETLGKSMTPQEFLADPKAQDAVFNSKFGGYVQKYGNPQDAASAWFTGGPQSTGADKKDVLGTTGSGYVAQFNHGLNGPQGGGTTPPQGAGGPPGGGMPAGGAMGSPQQLAAILSNPWLAPEMKQMVLQRAIPQYDFFTDATGTRYAQNKVTGQMSPMGHVAVPPVVAAPGSQIMTYDQNGQLQNANPNGGGDYRGNDTRALAIQAAVKRGDITQAQADDVLGGQTITLPNGTVTFASASDIANAPRMGPDGQPISAAATGARVLSQGAQSMDQVRAAAAASQANSANANILKYQTSGLGVLPKLSTEVPGIVQDLGVPFLHSEAGAGLQQAGAEFMRSIRPNEAGRSNRELYEEGQEVYLPKPGEGPEELAVKARARADAVRGLQGNAAPLPSGQRGETPPPSGARPRAVNPATGETLEFDGKSWVKAQ